MSSEVRAPRVGERRVYQGAKIPVLYPGECASPAPISFDDLVQAMESGEPFEVRDWLVEPSPGLYAWYLRWRYRLFGQWWQRIGSRRG